MAETETLNANAEDGGWVGGSGSIANIDEAIASADGSVLTCVLNDDVLVLDLTASAVEDADTVTGVDIVVRCFSNGASTKDSFDVELLVGGSPVGAAQSTGNLTGSMADYTLSLAAWDADKTASEMDGLQVRLTHRQTGKAEPVDTHLDCIDVNVTYDLPVIVPDPGPYKKPDAWEIDPGRTDPNFAWFWRGEMIAVPFLDARNASISRTVGRRRGANADNLSDIGFLKDGIGNVLEKTSATTDAVQVAGAIAPKSSDPVSLSVYYTPSSFASSMYIVSFGVSETATEFFSIRTLTTSGIVEGLTAFGSEIAGPSLVVGNRYLINYTYNGTNGRLYVNGNLVAGPTAQTSVMPASSGTFQIAGRPPPGTEGAQGTYYWGAIHGRELRPAEIRALWRDPFGPFRETRLNSFVVPVVGAGIQPYSMYHLMNNVGSGL
jgi:hypothetical protein